MSAQLPQPTSSQSGETHTLLRQAQSSNPLASILGSVAIIIGIYASFAPVVGVGGNVSRQDCREIAREVAKEHIAEHLDNPHPGAVSRSEMETKLNNLIDKVDAVAADAKHIKDDLTKIKIENARNTRGGRK